MVLEYRPDIWEYTHTYIYGADGLAYRRDADGTIYTYNTNFRGDVLSVMDENQNCMAEYVFDAYGNIFNQYNATGFSDNFGYRGEYHDPESGYIYLRMRYLDPTSGRFLTEDPAKDGLNWFSYCGGNPVKFTCLLYTSTCFAASTAESVAEAMAEQRGQEKYLESVHAPADNTEDNDHIDISTGNMVLSETDLYLPGKNGLDVTLSRNVNSMDTCLLYTSRCV